METGQLRRKQTAGTTVKPATSQAEPAGGSTDTVQLARQLLDSSVQLIPPRHNVLTEL